MSLHQLVVSIFGAKRAATLSIAPKGDSIALEIAGGFIGTIGARLTRDEAKAIAADLYRATQQ